MSRLAHLAADPAVLRHLAYPRGSKVGYRVTQPCPQNRPLDQVFAQSRDWERVAPPTLKLMPRYADSYKKRMDIAPNFHPHTGVASSNASISSSIAVPTLGDSPTDYFGLGKLAVVGEERYRSLTELKWGEFEAMVFGELDPAQKKVRFDLTESARTVRLDLGSLVFTKCSPTVSQSREAKRTTLTWTDYTEPAMGTEVVIEEAFMDVFRDLMYGGGWMEIEREEVDRECNCAL